MHTNVHSLINLSFDGRAGPPPLLKLLLLLQALLYAYTAVEFKSQVSAVRTLCTRMIATKYFVLRTSPYMCTAVLCTLE